MLSYEIAPNSAEAKEAPRHLARRHYRHPLLSPQATSVDLETTSYPSWGQECFPVFSHREFGDPRPPEIGLTDDPNDLLHLFMSDDLPSPPPFLPYPSPLLPPPACSLPPTFPIPPPPSSSSSFPFPPPTSHPHPQSLLVQPTSNTECRILDEPFLIQSTDLDYFFKDLDFTELNQNTGMGLGVPSEASRASAVCGSLQSPLQLLMPSSDELVPPPLNTSTTTTTAVSPLTPATALSSPLTPGVTSEPAGNSTCSSVASPVLSLSSAAAASCENVLLGADDPFAVALETAMAEAFVFYCGDGTDNSAAFEGVGGSSTGSDPPGASSPINSDDEDCSSFVMDGAQFLTREQFAVLHDHNYTSEPTHAFACLSSRQQDDNNFMSSLSSPSNSITTSVTSSLSTTPLSTTSPLSLPLPLSHSNITNVCCDGGSLFLSATSTSLAAHNHDDAIDPSSMDTNRPHAHTTAKSASSHSSSERYLRRRVKNNVASQASRAKRKARRCDLFERELQLLKENKMLRVRLEEMTAEAAELNKLLVRRLAK